jgi:membrane-associated phospholipid phosphatase
MPLRSRIKPHRRGAAALAVALALILAIALLLRWGILTGFNHRLMTAAGQARATDMGSALITPLMRAMSLIGATPGRLILLAVALGWLLRARRRRDAIWLTACVLGGTLLNLALKQIFAAPRPDLLPHLDIVHSFSFPSGHAAGNLIFFGAVAMLGRRRNGWAIATIVITFIGISRIWLGVHWPGDVAAGWIEGVGWLIFWKAFLPLDSSAVRSYPVGSNRQGKASPP